MHEDLLQIPQRIKELREILEISSLEMAEKLGKSLEEYERYERGESDIPISALYEIASIFNTDMTVLLMGDSPRMDSYSVVRAGTGIDIERFAGYRYQSLAFNFIKRVMEPLLVTLEVGKYPKLVMHSGQEFNYVLEGSIRLVIDKSELLLHKGDSVYFNARLPHGQYAVDGPAAFLTVITEHESPAQAEH